MTKKESTTYSWNLGRKLAGVENGKSIQFAYDHTGLRTRKKVDGAATLYHYAGSLLTSMESGGTVTHFGYDANGQVITMYTGGNRYFYIRNGQGDINGLVDEAGNQAVEYKYYTWGAMRSTTGTLASTIGKLNPFRYRGYFYDDETKLYYVGSRYYDPQIRRWISPDSNLSGIGGSILGNNGYIYCFNNASTLCDPTGNWPSISKVFTTILAGTTAAAHVAVETVKTTYKNVVGAVSSGTTLVSDIGAAIKERINTIVPITSKKHEWSGNSVYIMKEKDYPHEVGYVGRTNDPIRRQREHRRDQSKRDLRDLEVVATNLTKGEARIVEQALISSYTLENLHNARREIAGGNVMKAMTYMENSIRLFEGFAKDELINFVEGN